MIGVGDWHKKVPKDPRANRLFRKALLLRALGDRGFRRGVMEVCRRDILFYVNTFVWQFNPKKKGREAYAPFITWPFQDRALTNDGDGDPPGLLWCYERDKNAVVQKSREMGATWLFLILQDWLCLFRNYVQCLNISRSAEAVDDKSPDSLFWKIRFMHRHLPDWMRGEVDEQKMYFGYKRTESVNTGEASTGRAGVGGRAGLIFVDEVSKIREAMEVRQRTANTADCRFFNSTHEGTDTEFYRLTQTPEMVQITMHWTEHPEKRKGLYRSTLKDGRPDVLDGDYQYPPDFRFVLDGTPTGGPFPGLRSPWYDQKCVDIGSERGVAVELDINPTGSVSQFFKPLAIRDLQEKYCRPAAWTGDLYFDHDQAKAIDFIPAPGGPLRLWVNLDYRGRVVPGVYVFGADISSGYGGKGSTSSCLSGADCRTGEKILEYASPFIDPEPFAALAVSLCRAFADEEGEPATLIWEMQGPGAKFGKRVIELGYRRVYYRTNEANPTGKARTYSEPGWFPTRDNTRVLLEDYRAGLTSEKFVNRSKEALEECLYWSYTPQGIKHSGASSGPDPSGAGVNHGDRSMADALCWRLARGLGRKLQKEEAARVEPGSLGWRRQLAESAEREQQEW